MTVEQDAARLVATRADQGFPPQVENSDALAQITNVLIAVADREAQRGSTMTKDPDRRRIDYQALAKLSLQEAIDAGRLPAQPSDEEVQIFIRAWMEARKAKRRG